MMASRSSTCWPRTRYPVRNTRHPAYPPYHVRHGSPGKFVVIFIRYLRGNPWLQLWGGNGHAALAGQGTTTVRWSLDTLPHCLVDRIWPQVLGCLAWELCPWCDSHHGGA
jgi:hypothetical protein